MSSVSEASELIRRIAGPREAGESIKAAIVKTARRLGFSYSRTRDIWYGNARRIDANEMDALREREARLDRDRAIAAVVVIRERLVSTDEDFHGPTVAALDGALRAMGAEVRAMAVREE